MLNEDDIPTLDTAVEIPEGVLTIELRLDSVDFCSPGDAALCLQRIADALMHSQTWRSAEQSAWDTSGNKVGVWKFTPTR